MGTYQRNLETGKLEMYFDKSEYMALPETSKKEIKSNFLFSKARGAWVSRAKFPNLYRAERVAKELGLEYTGKSGEVLSFGEQQQRKAERAEARAERYEQRAEKAAERGENLQKPINDMRGDTAFFTQPNINSSAGRAFTKRRNAMFAAFERGWDEFKKSEYYEEKAATARETAAETKPTDKGFIDRRIKDAEKTIRAQKKNIDHYNEMLEKIRAGVKITKVYGDGCITEEEVLEWLENAEEIVDNAISKAAYYHMCMDELGGVQFSKENIKPGYVVEIKRWGKCRVASAGKVNITFCIMEGGAAGGILKTAYAEIMDVISKEIPDKPEHPFEVGDEFTVDRWNDEKRERESVKYKVTKITPERVTLKCGNERAISRKPRKAYHGEWAIGIIDGYGGTVYKKEKTQ